MSFLDEMNAGWRSCDYEPSLLAAFLNACKGRLFFIGNGGSAAIASHMAIDFAKTTGIPSMCFSDGAALTCLANDLGYDQVFAHPMRQHAKPGDILIAISSSGKSPNILNAIAAARDKGATVITFSGMQMDNPMRHLGEMNFYVPSLDYGVVEATHLAMIHAALREVAGVRTIAT